ncbi:MAG TPA: ABC transporter permease [Stellaceae bacterium]|jgi:ribose transport system permease protein|nr:ABC transporter permease [Stellaceae bacterium]
MARASEAPVLPARLRPTLWRRGIPQTQTAYVAVALAVLIVVIWVLAPVFMTPRNLLNISKNFSFIALMSLGETLVIISGGIDLSVGSVCALSAVVTMMLMRFFSATAAVQVPGATIALAALLALALAALIGVVNGLLIARIRLSPFVTTLGMLSVARGMTYVVTQGRAQYPVGPDVASFTQFANGALLGLPTQLVYLLVLAVLMALALRHLVWGRHLYAVGGNAQAAALTGVRVPRVVLSVYVLSGLAAGFSGVLIAGWLGAAPANLATGYELRVIAAAVIGGANLAGGVGGAAGAVIGAALIEVIRNGFVLIGANTYWEEVFVGVIIIIAVLVDQLRTRRVV